MHDSLWQAVLGEIELSVSRGNFLTWFKNTKLLRKADNQIVIGVPNVFIKNQLEKKYADLISGVLVKNGIEEPSVEFKIHATLAPSKQKNDDLPIELTLQSTTHTPAPRAQSTQVGHSYRQGLNERYTFETFVVGSGNELAYAAYQAIAKQPGTKYNPLFLYGGVGIGKTHLIQAVGNDVLADNPNARIVYVSCEQFVQEFLDAINNKTPRG
jgi:chromosomal replication initiator protein